MTQPFPKTLVLDIGKSWTKAFVVDNDKNKLVIEKKASLPTSLGDPNFSTTKLISKLKISKETKILITGSLPEGKTVAANLAADYVSEEEALEVLGAYFAKSEFKNPVIFDAGSYAYSSSTKINQIGAFLTREINDVDIENYFGNKSLKPQAIPADLTELEIEEAFYRVAFSQDSNFIKSNGNIVNILVTGAFFSLAPAQAKLALIILDILAKGRAAQVKLDRGLFVQSFGALLKKYPQTNDFEIDFLLDLGAAVSLGGKGTVMLDYGFSEKQELSIVEDEIALIPSPQKQKIDVTIVENKEKIKVKLSGGAFGVLIDGRVKPLKLAFGRAESRQANKRWQEAIEKVELIV